MTFQKEGFLSMDNTIQLLFYLFYSPHLWEGSTLPSMFKGQWLPTVADPRGLCGCCSSTDLPWQMVAIRSVGWSSLSPATPLISSSQNQFETREWTKAFYPTRLKDHPLLCTLQYTAQYSNHHPLHKTMGEERWITWDAINCRPCTCARVVGVSLVSVPTWARPNFTLETREEKTGRKTNNQPLSKLCNIGIKKTERCK